MSEAETFCAGAVAFVAALALGVYAVQRIGRALRP